MLKRILALGVAIVGLSAAPALAQQYPPKDNKIDVSTMTPCPAEPFTVKAQTFEPGSTVTAQLASTSAVLGTATADGQGVATFEISIPDSPAPGASVQRDIQVVGTSSDGGELTLSAAVEIRDCSEGAPPAVVPAATPPGGDGDLPRTGASNTWTLVQIGLGLAAVGGVLLALGRRRRNAAHLRTAS